MRSKVWLLRSKGEIFKELLIVDEELKKEKQMKTTAWNAAIDGQKMSNDIVAEAKAIIRTIMGLDCGYGHSASVELMERVERFLGEV
jgi:chromosome condensin MukBEF MukE localization factor